MSILSAGLTSVETEGVFYDSCPAEVAESSTAVLSVFSSPPKVCDGFLVLRIMYSFFSDVSDGFVHHVHIWSVCQSQVRYICSIKWVWCRWGGGLAWKTVFTSIGYKSK